MQPYPHTCRAAAHAMTNGPVTVSSFALEQAERTCLISNSLRGERTLRMEILPASTQPSTQESAAS